MRKCVKKTLLILSAFMIMAGCAPVITQKTLDSVTPGVAFSELLKDPSKYAGATVLLGGRIIRADNTEDKTFIEVLQERLGRNLKPEGEGTSEGRFILEFNGFLDPVVYGPGRLITAAGAVKNKAEVRPLGKLSYAYPVIIPKEHYLWRMGGDGAGFSIGVGIIHGY